MSFSDFQGVRHEIDVDAETLYEAAALALRSFQKNEWCDDIWKINAVRVVARAPEVVHTVDLRKVEAFLKRSHGSPREITLRQRLKRILAGE